MAAVKEHYERLLAEYYSWISGGFAQKLRQNKRFFKTHNVWPAHSGVAVDLGAGCGFQSIPLAQMGFTVLAIDSSKRLLAELRQNSQGFSIKTINDDMLNFDRHCDGPIELVVCMGDVLTHLTTRKTIRCLLKKIFKTLEAGGRLILTFRDLSVELTGLDRFIPVRNDSSTIFTCFLEYEKNFVKVHDIIYERTHNRWKLKRGYFRKIRILPQWLIKTLQALGFKIDTFDIHNASVCVIAVKPSHGN